MKPVHGFVLQDYKAWGWQDEIKDPAYLCFSKKIKTISGKGLVQKEKSDFWLDEKKLPGNTVLLADYMAYREIPSILLDEINWSYK